MNYQTKPKIAPMVKRVVQIMITKDQQQDKCGGTLIKISTKKPKPLQILWKQIHNRQPEIQNRSNTLIVKKRKMWKQRREVGEEKCIYYFKTPQEFWQTSQRAVAAAFSGSGFFTRSNRPSAEYRVPRKTGIKQKIYKIWTRPWTFILVCASVSQGGDAEDTLF